MFKNKKHKNTIWGLPWWLGGKESAYQCRRRRFHPRSRKIPQAAEQCSPMCKMGVIILMSPQVANTRADVSVLRSQAAKTPTGGPAFVRCSLCTGHPSSTPTTMWMRWVTENTSPDHRQEPQRSSNSRPSNCKAVNST